VSRQFRRTVARTPPPAFLFPDQRFQRPRTGEPILPFSARLRRRRRCSRLGFPCQAVLSKKNPFSAAPPEAREAVFTASVFCVKWFFLKKNLSLQIRPEGRWRRLPKEAASPCQPGLSAISRSRGSRPSRPQKTAERSERLPSFVSDDSIEGAELNRNRLRKQEAEASFFPRSLGDLGLRGPGGRPVSERGGDIRSGHFVRKPIPTVLRTFSRSPGRWTRAFLRPPASCPSAPPALQPAAI
jgi:hypothetical protein